ncbi:hypothetical protein O53_2588 [Microcystis aeruginosa TAIHU98]|uniref:Uncharacterized protein n=1 Tax=Microcystis aeruginosa TAIHU98 TaxID=1134457 RepID=L7E2V3_MICAE|nr:hypothetical protein O53_2588 [Microcystis aeruginosa TAIHU98]
MTDHNSYYSKIMAAVTSTVVKESAEELTNSTEQRSNHR